MFKIAMERFTKAFSSLGARRQKEVKDTQHHEQKWRNDHAHLRIFSISCEKTVPVWCPRILPCSTCSVLLSSKSFKKTLKKPSPDPANVIYTNKEFRNQVLGEIYGRTVGLKDIIKQPVSRLTLLANKSFNY